MNIPYYLKRIGQLGVKESLERFKARTKQQLIYLYWRSKAHNKTAAASWETLAATHGISSDFKRFFKLLTNAPLMSQIAKNPQFMTLLPSAFQDPAEQMRQADNTVHRRFTLLGASQEFEKGEIPWHNDFKKSSAPQPFWQTIEARSTYHADLTIPVNHQLTIDGYAPDIKVPWELSRFHHLSQLGHAYQIHKDIDLVVAQTYVDSFVEQLTDWHEKNNFMLGVNWVCPMDVAIRAVNLMWAFHYFKDAPTIKESFWKQVVCSLYNHTIYLEQHWETSATPNNHYLADLIGYYYLSSFFNCFEKYAATQAVFFKRLCDAFDQQILADGTCYEGTTSYHTLITEFLLHASLIASAQDHVMPSHLQNKLDSMIAFIKNCQTTEVQAVQIGDNDSGKLLFGLHHTPPENQPNACFHYPQFGLSIIRNAPFTLTYRHPVYTKKQPTGHFHNDQLSVTLSYENIPFIIDPGTFVYTANPQLRNILRSAQSHSTFYATTDEASSLWKANTISADLFSLARTPQQDSSFLSLTEQHIVLENWHNEYAPHGLIPHRKLSLDKVNHTVLIEDWWNNQKKMVNDQLSDTMISSHWNYTFHPDVTLTRNGDHEWLLTAHDKALRMTSNLTFTVTLGYFSAAYGKIVDTHKLTAHDTLKVKAFTHFEPVT